MQSGFAPGRESGAGELGVVQLEQAMGLVVLVVEWGRDRGTDQ